MRIGSKITLATVAALGTFLAGCDVATAPSEPTPVAAAREATAKADGPSPFGTKFVWAKSFNWNMADYNTTGADIAFFFDNNPVDDCIGCGIIKRIDGIGNTTTSPGVYTYVIANGVRSDLRATDCNVYTYDTINGVAVRRPTLCNSAGGWISTHRDTILTRYKRYAQRIQKTLDTTKVNKKPFVYLLEGDYFQYSANTQDVYLTPAYLGKLIGDVADTIKKYNPKSVIGFNTSGWYDPAFMGEVFRAMSKKSMGFTWISTGFDSDTLDNNYIKSAISTVTWVRRYTGLPVFHNGSLRDTTPKADFLARTATGSVGAFFPTTATAQANAKAWGPTAVLPTSFPDLAPQGTVTGVSRVNTSSVKVSFRAWDRDAKIGVSTPSQLREVKVFLNGIPYQVLTIPQNPTNATFAATVSNLPVSLAKQITLRVTDHDGLVTMLPAVNADSIAIDTNSYAFSLTTEKSAAGAWLPTNAVRFKIPDRTPDNQRVRFEMYDVNTGAKVASIYSDENDAAGTNLWGATWTYADAIQIPSTVPAGTYRFVMLYNDDNLRANYKMAFSLRSSILRFDPNIVYDPWNADYCRTGFVMSATTGFCVAK